MLRICVNRAADEWLCLAALACQPFIPVIGYDVMAELLEEHARHETAGRDE